MRKFAINVNGKSYEVEVEELGQSTVTSPRPVSAPVVSAPAPAPQSAPKKADTPAPKAASSGTIPQGAETIKAPMPGTILEVKVQAGEKISKGQVLAILEAMKMENEIMSPRDGEIVSIQVANGASVNAGDVLIAIE